MPLLNVGTDQTNLIHLIQEYSLTFKRTHPTPSIAKDCFNQLNLLVNTQWDGCDEPTKTKVLQVQLTLTAVIVGSGKSSLIAKTYKKLSLFWKSIGIENYVKILSKLTINYDPSFVIHLIITWDFVIRFCVEKKNSEIIVKNKQVLNDIFLKNVVGSKNKLSSDIISLGLKYFLKQIDHDDFSKSVLPALQKALLRNPEIIFNLTPNILKGLSLDLSPYALDLGKLFATNLYSKDDSLRADAILATRNLAEQCSNSAAIESLIDHYFAVLNGSEGKLTVAIQRFGVLSGIGALSYHSANGEAQYLSEAACRKFVGALKQEVHEGTILHATSQLQLWCSRLTNEIPSIFIEWFKSLPNIKTTNSVIKSSYLLCLTAAFKSNMVEQIGEIFPLLLTSAQKSFQATVSQLPLLTEGLYSTNLILKLCSLDKQYGKSNKKKKKLINQTLILFYLDSKAKAVIQAILAPEKLAFLSDKFINSANEETLLVLLQLIESLVLNFEKKLKEKFKYEIVNIIFLIY